MDKYRPHLHYELKIDGEYVNPIIDSKTLINPQLLITPIHLGTIESSIIIEQKKILEINTSAVQLFPKQIILKHEKF